MDTKGIASKGQAGIDGIHSRRTEKAENNAEVTPASANATTAANINSENYGVNLSPRARELAEARLKATQIARDTPDIREDRVAELKKRIASGEYKVDPGKIADGMAQEAIRDQLAMQMHEEAKKR